MIRTRVLVGTLLALGAAGVLVGDTYLAQNGFAYFPFLFAFLMLAGALGSRELVNLFPPTTRPSQTLVSVGVLLLIASNWWLTVRHEFNLTTIPPWSMFVGAFVDVL